MRLRQLIQECSGACGDLGTFIPHVTGAITVAGLAPFGVLFGFAAFLIVSGLSYGLPVPVQPMKAISAVILTEGLRPGEVAAAGITIGMVLLVLGFSGASRFSRLIPQSVSAGLQLGLGLLMGVLGLKLILQTPWIGFAALILLFLLSRVPNCPSALITLIGTAFIGWLANGSPLAPLPLALEMSTPQLVVPTWSDFWESFQLAVLPQMTLTLTNAVIVTAALARELFPASAQVASERNLALSSGLANVLLCPFGAMPMCHGAGGLQAQYRFGARTGLAPILFGAFLLVLALGFAKGASTLFAMIPKGAVGALLIFAGTDLATSRRLFDARPSCWPVIAAAATATAAFNPAIGLVSGWIAEFIRAVISRRMTRDVANIKPS